MYRTYYIQAQLQRLELDLRGLAVGGYGKRVTDIAEGLS